MPKTKKRNVFISYYHEQDQEYKNRFVRMMQDHIVDKSVNVGNIVDQNLPLDEIRRKIRDDYIADATVTIVLIGPCTWQRKHVDWEISSSIRKTQKNPRCGLLGIRLPNHTDFEKQEFNERLIPPRLAINTRGKDPYAMVHRWNGSDNQVNSVRKWIDAAFERKGGTPPNDNLDMFARNRTTDCARGWQP